MIICSLRIAGFGRLVGRRFDFAPGLNVVYGENESGKSTLANAVVATLYGPERRKELWRPWTGSAYSTILSYTLANGEAIEIQRDFTRDSKGLHVYDRAGNELSAKLGCHKAVPGQAHLGIPLEVFTNAACVKQQAVAIEDGKDAGSLAAHLARALDGGPSDDAAIGAIARLDEALRTHIGTALARKNTPLRTLRERADAAREAAETERARIASLDERRSRMQLAAQDADALIQTIDGIDARLRDLRAGTIAKRLANLSRFRTELAELQAAHARYADVTELDAQREAEIESAFHVCQSSERVAEAAAADADSAQIADSERVELERDRGLGALDDDAYELIAQAHDAALAAQTAAASATEITPGRAKRRDGTLAAVIVAFCVALGCAIAHAWNWMGIAAGVALVLLFAAAAAWRRGSHSAAPTSPPVRADRTRAAQAAADALADALQPLGVGTFAELVVRRARARELAAREREARRIAHRAAERRAASEAAASHFDGLVAAIFPTATGTRAERHALVSAAAARRRERDGIAAHLHALELQRSTILGDDDEFLLEDELADLMCDGVHPADDEPGAARALETQRSRLTESLRRATETRLRLAGEIEALSTDIADLAELDERVAVIGAQIARLEAFERAVVIARTVIDERTRQAHLAFARRLEAHAGSILAQITAGRYGEIFVDSATLAIRVRVPETQSIVELAALSAGTRDQVYLVVRLAMARLFADGLETPPILLDDPFAYWDAERIERCLPVIESAAHGAQAILFTSSREVAEVARQRGAVRIDLPQAALV